MEWAPRTQEQVEGNNPRRFFCGNVSLGVPLNDQGLVRKVGRGEKFQRSRGAGGSSQKELHDERSRPILRGCFSRESQGLKKDT